MFVSLDRAGDAAPDVPRDLFARRHVIPNGADTMTGRRAIPDNLFVRTSASHIG